MIRRADAMRAVHNENFRGGNGTLTMHHILEAEEMHGKGSLFARVILPPGASIGEHTHTGNFETFYILKGRAKLTDNGQILELGPGDGHLCDDGGSHALENIGAEDLELVAVIQNNKS